jgi:hypothetical protein
LNHRLPQQSIENVGRVRENAGVDGKAKTAAVRHRSSKNLARVRENITRLPLLFKESYTALRPVVLLHRQHVWGAWVHWATDRA